MRFAQFTMPPEFGYFTAPALSESPAHLRESNALCAIHYAAGVWLLYRLRTFLDGLLI